ncbi:mobile mystery protein B [Thioalkalivibrio sp. XN279]|uniref:mobile mystery protein B n=1 Tax=Thioalkalivibrio sp. XN279 TaxID=2714953 RepID=UPI00140B8C80|nr:mobile mystery protein B [Thioalkalivibrio sp. XN279]NHA14131.1 mobile mystery protein B [Thioalkalivibrio sp. XN279]
MNDPLGPRDDAETPLSPEEREGIIPSYITLRGELNAAEQDNILEAESWGFRRRRNVLDESFLSNLHRRMYGRVWRWAGQYRHSDKNIGVDWPTIPQHLRQLLDDVRFWVDHHTYGADEIAARFHHRLVWIHCYPNGNGRHGRLAADLLLASLGQPRFSWGRANLVDVSETRLRYVAALRAADSHDIVPLLEFVRS